MHRRYIYRLRGQNYPATMGYINVVIPSVKVNRAEEGIGNPEYILLWFYGNQKSRIGIGSSYPMTYFVDGIYIHSEHGGMPVTLTRGGKGSILRLCRSSMESMPYGHRRNTERVRGP